MSNSLNNYFSTIGQNLANSIKESLDQDSDESQSMIDFNKYFCVKRNSTEIIINHKYNK